MVKTDHIIMPENHMEELYHSKNLVIRFVHNKRLDKILDIFPKETKNLILDAGCGEGQLLEKLHSRFSDNAYYGADITDVALTYAKGRCQFAHFYKANLGKLPFKKEFFDVIICTEVIEHIYEYETVIFEFLRVLKKGGILIISFPNEPLWTLGRFFLGRRPIKVPDHVNSFTPKKLKAKINMMQLGQWSVPFSLPFAFSLGCVIKFKKL